MKIQNLTNVPEATELVRDLARKLKSLTSFYYTLLFLQDIVAAIYWCPHRIFSPALCRTRGYYCSQFMPEETEVQRNSKTCWSSQSKQKGAKI